MKKGQTELIGIVIVVVIVLIGALFYVRFAVLDVQEPRAISTIRVTQAFNLMNGLINLDLCEEDPKSIKTALAQCEKEPAADFCDGKNACLYIEEEMPLIVDPIMTDTIGLQYSFSAKRGENEFLSFGDCTVGENSPPLRFKEQGAQYTATFKLCKGQ